ncbi:MAG: undecaprenyl-diphosphate phosphatase [Archaeoglobus sp.]|nr:undecaprenyl-diphosphate phosphatase [Archaeoglobus sp.]
MPSLVELVILSLIQGIAEWLPISSEGLSVFVLVKFFNSNPAEAISYAIYLHFGTMLAVILRFKSDFYRILTLNDRHLLKIIVIASVFTALSGIPFLQFLKNFQSGFEVTLFIGVMLVITGILLGIPKMGFRKLGEMRAIDMVLVGFFQGFAILPGISRSGTTISVLLLRRIDKEDALKVSFLISVPAVLGAVAIEFFQGNVELSTIGLIAIPITLVAGYLTMDLLLRIAKNLNFSYFCIALGLLTIIVTLLASLG